MSKQTVMELLEISLDFSLRAEIHKREWRRAMARRKPYDTPRLSEDAHYYAAVYFRNNADLFWRGIVDAKAA